MNYTEYNNQLKLPDDLYKKTLAGVKSEISKHNQIQRKKKVAYLSFAACFMILVTSISTVKYLNNNSSDTFEKLKLKILNIRKKLLLIIRFIRSIILEMQKRIRTIILS